MYNDVFYHMFVAIFVKPLSMINHGVGYSECLFTPDVLMKLINVYTVPLNI